MASKPKKSAIAFPVPCFYCGVSLSLLTHTWDHLVPRALGGSNRRTNLVHSCLACNSTKADSLYEDYLPGGKMDTTFWCHHCNERTQTCRHYTLVNQ